MRETWHLNIRGCETWVFVLLCAAMGSWGGSGSVIARALKESAWFWYAHLFSLLLARLPGVHSWKWVCAWGHHSWEHLFEPSRPHTGREQERCCEEMALKVGLCTGTEQDPGSCCWVWDQRSLHGAQAPAAVWDCRLCCKQNSHLTCAQMCAFWWLPGDPSRLLLCIPVLPRREARGSARRQQDTSRRHDRVYQSGQPQGSRWVSVSDMSQQSSARAVMWQCSMELGLPAGISVVAAFQAFTGIWNQVHVWAVYSCLSLGCCVGTCQVTQWVQQEVQGCSCSIWSLGCCRHARNRKQGCFVLV